MGKVHVAIWERDGKPGLVDPDWVTDCFYDDKSPEQVATEEVRRQERKKP